MENTALNGTTNATKDHEDWKKKKGYGPILVTVSLALLLSLYAGGYLGSGTHLRHDEMKTTNAAASSSSMSLVGSGTAASDWKTLTMETDGFVSFYQGGPCVWTEHLTQCMGLTKYDDIKTAEACKNACCNDSNCEVWQFDAIGHSNDCFYGSTCGSGGNGNWSYGGIRSGGRNPGAKCDNNSNCAIPPGLDHGVCLEGYCQPGTSRSFCGVTNDCVKPPGLIHPVCRDGRCQMGGTGSSCGATSDCVVPSGLEYPVCRHGKCQSGASGSSCGATSDCVVPSGLENPVCRQGKCQAGVFRDYCGQDSDCISGLHCNGFTNQAACTECFGGC